jgi:hypothetical protein
MPEGQTALRHVHIRVEVGRHSLKKNSKKKKNTKRPGVWLVVDHSALYIWLVTKLF